MKKGRKKGSWKGKSRGLYRRLVGGGEAKRAISNVAEWFEDCWEVPGEWHIVLLGAGLGISNRPGDDVLLSILTECRGAPHEMKQYSFTAISCSRYSDRICSGQ